MHLDDSNDVSHLCQWAKRSFVLCLVAKLSKDYAIMAYHLHPQSRLCRVRLLVWRLDQDANSDGKCLIEHDHCGSELWQGKTWWVGRNVSSLEVTSVRYFREPSVTAQWQTVPWFEEKSGAWCRKQKLMATIEATRNDIRPCVNLTLA